MKNKDKILEIIKERNITQLIHFTNEKNIYSILKNGLLNNDELHKRNLKYIYNDPERRDKWTFTISLSVTNKNSQLYEAFMYKQKLNNSDFVEIKINPNVIAEKECIFCDTNAANHTFDQYRQNKDDLDILKLHPAFNGMFKKIVKKHTLNTGGKIMRFNQKPNETTCNHAEICLIGNITPDKFINYDELKKFADGQ